MTDGSRPFLHRHYPTILICLALALVAGVMFGLVEQNRMLKASLRSGNASPPSESGLIIGRRFPDLPLAALTGESASLSEIIGGRVSVVGLLTTTCPSCAANLPQWQQLGSDLAVRGAAFFALSFDESERTRAYWAEHGLIWPVWTIPTAAQQLLVQARVPTTLLVNGEGVIVRMKVGVLSQLDREELLGEVTS